MHIYMGERILVVSASLCVEEDLPLILILTTTGMAHPHRTRRVVGVPVAGRRRHDVVVRVRPLLVVFSWFVVVGLLRPLSMTATAFRVVSNIKHRPGHPPSQHRRPSWDTEFSVLPKDLDMLKEEDCTCSTTTSPGATTPTPNPAASEELTWISLTEDGGVRKAVLPQQVGGDGLSDNQENKNQKNKNEDLSSRSLVTTASSSEVVISYQGRWVDAHWSTHEVLECWLLQQQGMSRNDPLYQAFQDHDMDEAKLTNNTVQQAHHPFLFTEAFVQNTLGVTSKMACKKLVMAARRLKAVREETVAGTVFDQKDHYIVTIGESNNKNNSRSSSSKTLIRGMRIALATMTVGEVSKIRIRSDYAYGPEGYRRSTGEVMVPPFCTLEFQVHVKSILPLSS
jgi:FKBP-type peptidyl-prolyl cis-trans isomerase